MTETIVSVLPMKVFNSTDVEIPSDDSRFLSRLLDWEDTVVGSYLGIVCIIAIVLNFLVIYTCLRNWKSLMISDYYILNLAFSDVLLPMTAFPLPISSSFFHRWMFGDIGCVIYGFLGFFFGLVSITTLTIMGLTRYLHVCQPHTNYGSLNTTKAAIAFPYVYALVWSTIPLSGWGSYSMESYGTSCTLQWDKNRVFITLMCMFCITTPSGVMVFSYTMIFLEYRKSNRNLRGWMGKSTAMSKKESYLIKITFAMCWGFLVTWMPYAVVSMWTAYGDTTYLPVRLTVVAVLLAKTSTVVNPVIYFLMNKKFRPLLLRSLKNDAGQRQVKQSKEIQRQPIEKQLADTQITKVKIEVKGQTIHRCSNPRSLSTDSDCSSCSVPVAVRHVRTVKLSVSTEDIEL